MSTETLSPDSIVRERLQSLEFGTNLTLDLRSLAAVIYQNAKNKGWWDENRNDGEMIALMHSELSEALEGLRANDPPSDKITQFTSVEEELADCIIRILDFAHARNKRVVEAIFAKMQYNSLRAVKHGGKKF